MTLKKIKPTTIEEYIKAASPEVQKKLRELHQSIRNAAPGAIENLKWNMPAYSYQKILVAFAVFKNHIGFYPMTTALKAYSKELANYKTTNIAIQFPLDKKLPVSLITKIVKFRVKESNDGTIKWRS